MHREVQIKQVHIDGLRHGTSGYRTVFISSLQNWKYCGNRRHTSWMPLS